MDPRAPRSDWSITQTLAIELAAYLDRVRPPRILEVGSGYSTAILAAYAEHHGAEVVTLEHDATYFRDTRRALRQLGVDRRLDLRLAPLRRQWFGARGPYWWYGVELEGEFDFVFIDGPPKVLGRRGAFFALQGHLRPGWQVWVDDGFRRHERQCVRLWEEAFAGAFLESCWDIDHKGVFVLRDANEVHDEPGIGATTDRLGIGVLGNGDPSWWRRAERYFGHRFLDSCYVVVMDRGEPPGRPLSAAAARFVDARPAGQGLLAERILTMFRLLAAQPGIRYVLYLDDRWWPSTLDTSWLRRGLGILEHQPDVERVALRHLADVSTTGAGEQRPVPEPFPREPSLLRADRLGTALQAGWAADRARCPGRSPAGLDPAPLWTVQLSPGVFRQNGGTGPPAAARPDPEERRTPAADRAVVHPTRPLVAATHAPA
jgi:Methyltransferase domain